jgi:pilus assembly protein Flp/PilA
MWAGVILPEASPETDKADRILRNAAYEERSMKRIRKFLKSDKGATAIEYGLIAALIAVVIIAALQLTGGSLQKVFNNVGSVLSSTVGN